MHQPDRRTLSSNSFLSGEHPAIFAFSEMILCIAWEIISRTDIPSESAHQLLQCFAREVSLIRDEFTTDIAGSARTADLSASMTCMLALLKLQVTVAPEVTGRSGRVMSMHEILAHKLDRECFRLTERAREATHRLSEARRGALVLELNDRLRDIKLRNVATYMDVYQHSAMAIPFDLTDLVTSFRLDAEATWLEFEKTLRSHQWIDRCYRVWNHLGIKPV